MLDQLMKKLRPEADTATAIRAAQARTAEAAAAIRKEIALLEAARGDLLLEGGANAEKHEAALRERRDEADRLIALAGALARKLGEAELREATDDARRAIADAKREIGAYSAFLADAYPAAARKIAEGMQMEERARSVLASALARLQALPEPLADIAIPAMPPLPIDLAAVGMGSAVRLPNPEGGAFWPAR